MANKRKTTTVEQSCKIRAEVTSITFRNEDNGWSVLRFLGADDGKIFVGVGTFAQISTGECYVLQGSWKQHQVYGPQLSITNSQRTEPHTPEALIRYLSSGLFKGIGEYTANKIVAAFGIKTLDIIDKQPLKIRKVAGIGKKTAAKIIASWEEQKHVAESLLFLNKHNITGVRAEKIVKKYGKETIRTISANPYTLIKDVRGFGFLTADKIALSLGIESTAPQRIQECIRYLLQKGEEFGHCFLFESQLLKSMSETLSLDEGVCLPHFAQALKALSEKNAVVASQETHGTVYSDLDLHCAEINIARQLKRLLLSGNENSQKQLEVVQARGWLEQLGTQQEFRLSKDQEEAVVAAVANKAFILTGGPGVGKSTTAHTIIRLFLEMGKKLALGAPTGRAAQRLKEITDMPVKTIHRLLEWSAAEHRFQRNEENPLSAEVVIIDEASMIDVRLADHLLCAIPSDARIILIGDVDQLPSVGPGSFLRDLIESRQIPTIKLQNIFRQAAASRIVRTAHEMNDGRVPTSLETEFDGDCKFLKAETPADILGIMKSLLATKLPQVGYDPARDVQILTPMNKGDLGSLNLNQEFQALLNPAQQGRAEFKRGNITLRSGDKVIQTVNNYDLSVFNGDIGYVALANVAERKILVNFGDREVYYDQEQVNELNLAYAVTVHKSQGSEFKAVIIPMCMSHYIMLQRNLIYTALTRAKKLAIFVGSFKALAHGVRNELSRKRQTRLREFLMKGVPSIGP